MIKAIKRDSSGVSPLKEIFLENKYHPTMPDIHITQKGVHKIPMNLNPNKATGPDGLSPQILHQS